MNCAAETLLLVAFLCIASAIGVAFVLALRRIDRILEKVVDEL